HIIVCGAGNVGTRVIEFLLEMGERVVVVERNPSGIIVELARDRQIELLRGDATDDTTLDFCDLEAAHSLVAITDSDTANLEAALGARARSPRLAVVARIRDHSFALSIGRQFGIEPSFSPTELTAPAIAGLARFPGTRGRVCFDGETYNIGERQPGEGPPPAHECVPLYLWRAGNLLPIHDFAEMKPEDRLLFIVPLSQFRTASATA
ncbi:MAG: NAD(P)-binding protein, partial [Candidatus Baltobacteraceae bacterium]